jgi:hypothetical protein
LVEKGDGRRGGRQGAEGLGGAPAQCGKETKSKRRQSGVAPLSPLVKIKFMIKVAVKLYPIDWEERRILPPSEIHGSAPNQRRIPA